MKLQFRQILLSLAIALFAASLALPQTPIRARTESGRDVILSPDGTWKYATESESHAPATRSTGGKTLFKAPQGNFGLWYDASKWSLGPDNDVEGRIKFKLKRGDAYAMLIIEELPVPIATLKAAALANAKSAATDARITFEGSTSIDGKEVLVMKIDGTIQEIPFRYFGYYYGGKNGTIQVLTYTGQSLFEKYEQDLAEFLNGLVIY